MVHRRAVTAVIVAIGLTLAAPAFAQAPVVETVTFDEAISRALEKNPTRRDRGDQHPALRSAAASRRARQIKPRLSGNVTNTTLDSGRSFGDQTVQPQNQSVFGLSASMPVLAATQWAARTQAMDQVEIARLSVTDTRRQIAVATASAYLAIIAQKRQVDVTLTAIETARGQLDYNTRRREGGVGSRLNELRSSQVLSAAEAQLEVLRFNVQRAQEALGVLLAANGPVDVQRRAGVRDPAGGDGGRVAAESSGHPRVHRATRRATSASSTTAACDWWPAASVNFGPQLLTPSGIFQPSRTWSLSVQLSQPIFEGGQRSGLRRQREAIFEASTLSLEQAQIEARSEVRIARAAVESRERALAAARQRVADAPTKC